MAFRQVSSEGMIGDVLISCRTSKLIHGGNGSLNSKKDFARRWMCRLVGHLLLIKKCCNYYY